MSGFTEMKTKKFAFFGCWNEVHYPSENPQENDAPCFQIQENEPKHKCDEFTSVLQEINEQNVDFLVVAGDNYYPIKKKDKTTGKKDKKFELQDFNKGFDALESIKKPTHLLLGNHDMENIDNCEIIKQEKQRTNLLFFDYENKNAMFRMIEDHTLLIMLDTNVFDPTEDFSCYSVFNEKNNVRESLIEKQKTNILAYLSTINTNKIRNVCFFGHHPLLSWKIKKEKVKLEDDMMELHAFLLDILTKKNLQKKTIYYFCAHLHQYQKGTVIISQKEHKITVHQYISGTGGAHLDPEIPREYIKKESKSVEYIDNIKSSYKMQESIKKNGFLTINTIKSYLLLVEFHTVEPSISNSTIKSVSKTRKSKTKSKIPSRYSSLLKTLHISQSLGGGKTRRIKRKSKKNKH